MKPEGRGRVPTAAVPGDAVVRAACGITRGPTPPPCASPRLRSAEAVALRSLLASALFFVGSLAASGAVPAPRVSFEDSIVALPTGTAGEQARIVRRTLTPDELAAPMYFVVSLRMRHFAELEARIQSGETVPQEEMEETYLPLAGDFERVSSWLEAQGFTLTLRDRSHTNVFARASVARIASVLGASFARVVTEDGERTTAIGPPSLPAALAPAVLSISGLQPHLAARRPSHGTVAAGALGGIAGAPTPADIALAYNVPAGLTGAGQTIAVICDGTPAASDLTSFWSQCGISQSIGNFAMVPVNGGSSANADPFESTLDVEWASSMAPGATVRLYTIPDFLYASIVTAATQVLNDLPQFPGLHQVSISIYGAENVAGNPTILLSYSQTYAQLAAAGITVLACSGDGGSNPNPANINGYSTAYPLTVGYPASDPNLTGVGGTTLAFNPDWTTSGETTWFTSSAPGATTPVGTGGGISGVFARPSWQRGSGVPSGSMRCVPDVSAQSNAGFQVLNGSNYASWGTSLATPIWAGIVALMNEARSNAGIAGVGLLAARVYAHIGSNAFTDITAGANGAYAAGAGYDLCTGVGSPNVANLITRIDEEATSVDAPAGPVDAGSPVSMSITSQVPQSTYQWRLNGRDIGGATHAAYSISAASAADAGSYTVVITNVPFGSLTYNLGTLTVNAAAPPTAASTRLINISTRAQVGTGANILIPGFVVSGSGTETLLIRGDGPSLSQFGVTGVLAQPTLGVYSGSTLIAANTAWGTAANPAQIAGMAAQVGAFAFAPGSADCAVIVTLTAGSYTVQVSGLNGSTGVALAEIYEVASTGTRLVNVSTRAMVGTGGAILIPGFVVSGSGSEQLLVRADGPGLVPFNVTGVIAQTSLGVYQGSTLIAANTGWGTSAAPALIASTAAQVGAFMLASNSGDSAQIVNVPAGAYTMQVSGAGDTTGVALAEIYEVP